LSGYCRKLELKSLKKIIIGILAIIGAIYLILLASLYSSSDCRYYLKSAASSPDDKYLATYEHRICQSEPDSISVRLDKVDNSISYIILSAESADVQKINLTWLNNNELEITYPFSLAPGSPVHDKEFGEIYVKYKYFK
jgi:hypothetical protein